MDNDADLKKLESYNFNVHVEGVERNIGKMATFLAWAIIMAIIGFSYYSPNFLKALLTNSTLILCACASGFMHANKTIKNHMFVYERRNAFLHNYLNIDIEYKEATTV